MMSCKEATRLMSDEMDRDLPAGERFSLRLHTLICVGCRNYRQQLSFLRLACRQEAPPADEAQTSSPPQPPD